MLASTCKHTVHNYMLKAIYKYKDTVNEKSESSHFCRVFNRNCSC